MIVCCFPFCIIIRIISVRLAGGAGRRVKHDREMRRIIFGVRRPWLNCRIGMEMEWKWEGRKDKMEEIRDAAAVA